MSDVTQILQQIDAGKASAAEDLLPLVYDELHKLAQVKMAAERPDHTLQATALVHEAYLRLVDQDEPQQFSGRAHFYMAAAEAMRRILIESARSKRRLKRGGDRRRVDVEDFATTTCVDTPDQLLELDEALTKLEAEDPAVAELVRLRLYAGLSTRKAASVLGIPRSTAHDYWRFALSWFTVEMDR